MRASETIIKFIEDLEREFCTGVVILIRTGDFLFQFYPSRVSSGQVKAELQVGCAGTALHVEHPHVMRGIVFEDVRSVPQDKLAIQVILYFSSSRVRITCHIIRSEDIIQGCRPGGLTGCGRREFYNASTEVNGTSDSTVDTAEVENQFAINIQPEVIVSCELEDNIMAPCIFTIGELHKACGHFHAEIVICFFQRDFIQFFACTSTITGQHVAVYIRYVNGMVNGKASRIDFIVWHELSMVNRRSYTRKVYCSKLTIYGECLAIIIQ